MDVYAARLKSFGFHTLVVDGHDVTELVKSFDEAASVSGKPTAVVAKTYKGRGFPGIEDKENWHGKALGAEGDKIIKQLSSIGNMGIMKAALHAAAAVLSVLLFFMQLRRTLAASFYKNLNIRVGQYLFRSNNRGMKIYSICSFEPPQHKKDPDIDIELIGKEPFD